MNRDCLVVIAESAVIIMVSNAVVNPVFPILTAFVKLLIKLETAVAALDAEPSKAATKSSRLTVARESNAALKVPTPLGSNPTIFLMESISLFIVPMLKSTEIGS